MVDDGERVAASNVVGREKGVIGGERGVGGGDRGGRERDVGVEKNVVVIGEGDVAVSVGVRRRRNWDATGDGIRWLGD